MSEILERLYLGSSLEARDKDWLDTKGVTHILNVAKELPEYFPGDFMYKKLPFEDTENFKMFKYFADILCFLDTALEQGTVLVHCMMGISRSATVVVLYLMARKGLTCSTARKFVKDRRSFVSPNKGFVTQLMNYEMLYLKREKKQTPLTLRYTNIALTGRQNSPKKKQSQAVHDKKAKGEELVTFIKMYIKASSDIDFPHSKPLVKEQAVIFEPQSVEKQSGDSIVEQLASPIKLRPVISDPATNDSGKKLASCIATCNLYKHVSIKNLKSEKNPLKCSKNIDHKVCLKMNSPASRKVNRSAVECKVSSDSPEPKLTIKERREFFKSRNTTDSVPKMNRQQKKMSFKSMLIDPIWNKKRLFNKEIMIDKSNKPLKNASKLAIQHTSPVMSENFHGGESPANKEMIKLDFFKKTETTKVGAYIQETNLPKKISQSPQMRVPVSVKNQRISPSITLSKVKRFETHNKKFKTSSSLDCIHSES
jgi:atypical dual specificity phosphatase